MRLALDVAVPVGTAASLPVRNIVDRHPRGACGLPEILSMSNHTRYPSLPVLFFSRLFSKIPIIAQHKKEPQLAKRSIGAAVLQNQNLFAGCISVILFWIIRDNVNDPHVVRIESRCLEKRLLQFRHSFFGYLKDFIPFTKGHSSRRT